MIEKRKLESDKKLIQVLFATEPLDWARRDDGTLVFLYQDGRKMVVTPEDLATMTNKKLAEKEAAQRKTTGSSERTSGEVRGDTRLGTASGRTTVGHPAVKTPAATGRSDPQEAGSGDAHLQANSNRAAGGPTVKPKPKK